MSRGQLTVLKKLTKPLTCRFGATAGSAGSVVRQQLSAVTGCSILGNVVPACKGCNDIKKGNLWQVHSKLDAQRRDAIGTYISEYDYNPDVVELKLVLSKLYDLADGQTRALVDFALVAAQPYIAGFHKQVLPITDEGTDITDDGTDDLDDGVAD